MNLRKYKLVRNGYGKKHPFYDLAKDYDGFGFMSKSLGKELSRLFHEDYEIGIHRTGHTYVNEEILQDIFNNGLINNGDAMQGTDSSSNNNIKKTVSFFSDFILLNGQLKVACDYKGSNGCIIVKIPKSYIGNKDGEVKPIFYNDGNVNRLLPEFIYGYVPVNNYVCGEIIRNPNYCDYHNYSNDGLIYELNAETPSYIK